MSFFKTNKLKALEAFAGAFIRAHPIIEFDASAKCVFANDIFCGQLGLEPGALIGRTLKESFKAATSEDLDAYWQVVIAGQLRSGIFGFTAQGITDRWLQLVPTVVPGKSASGVRIVFVALDVTTAEKARQHEHSRLEASNLSQAVLEMDVGGTVLSANANFARILGYAPSELVGKDHSTFVKPALRSNDAEQSLWSRLRGGNSASGEFQRVNKAGTDVWILGSYTPVLDQSGNTVKVVHVATDITESKLGSSNLAAQVTAIGRSQAVIEFNLDGTIITANDNFLSTLGYELRDIVGRHHRLFVTDEERNSLAYSEFWRQLNDGQYMTGEYHRVGKAGNSVWIQASYNPVFDIDGKPAKIVKYATDTTMQVRQRMANERVRGMMESVAAGAEELNASVREISEAMTKSRETATCAVLQVEAADNQASRLNDAAMAMSGIVEMIGKITGQINLLALNATIESARAGEAGRGFAVVASEVKNLATQAKQATDKIGQEIASLNDISGEVVGALGKIKAAMQNVSEYVTTTAATVEEQSVVTSEMSSSMQRAASEAAAAVA